MHYVLVNGEALTVLDNSMFDLINNKWVSANFGITPDIEIYQEAYSLVKGDEPSLLRSVKELMKQLK